MKKAISILLLATLLVFIVLSTSGMAEVRASVAFKVTTIALTDDMYVEFRATTNNVYNTIKISSCTLEVMDGTNVSSSKSLTPPSTTATNTDMFVASANYKSEVSSGKSYRIKAVFWADGYTVTAYSRIVSF